MVLNMYDELERKGDILDYESLGKLIGIPIIPTVSSKGTGIREVFQKAIEVFEDRNETLRHIHINYGDIVEGAIKQIQEQIKREGNERINDLVSSRFLSIRLLENDREASKKVMQYCHNQGDILTIAHRQCEKIEKEYQENPETVITDLRYGFIAGALKETLSPAGSELKRTSQAIDIPCSHINILVFRYLCSLCGSCSLPRSFWAVIPWNG
jgi:ferrous iron transport protein B